MHSLFLTPYSRVIHIPDSVEIVAIRDDFSERGCVRRTSRSALQPPEPPLALQLFVPFLHAAAGPVDTAALLWLRLCRAGLYCPGVSPRRNANDVLTSSPRLPQRGYLGTQQTASTPNGVVEDDSKMVTTPLGSFSALIVHPR